MTKLKQERLKRNMSLRQLAVILNLSFQYVSLLENGKRKPSFDVSANLKLFFGIPADILLAITNDDVPIGS